MNRMSCLDIYIEIRIGQISQIIIFVFNMCMEQLITIFLNNRIVNLDLI